MDENLRSATKVYKTHYDLVEMGGSSGPSCLHDACGAECGGGQDILMVQGGPYSLDGSADPCGSYGLGGQCKIVLLRLDTFTYVGSWAVTNIWALA